MNPEHARPTHDDNGSTPAVVVRDAIASLNAVDPATADHLNALAFILMRVARADGLVDADERRRMEEILCEHAGIPPEHAALVTEIARHRAELADCGCSYSISRDLRDTLDAALRESVIGFLTGVAEADGRVSAAEHDELAQIAGELGFARG